MYIQNKIAVETVLYKLGIDFNTEAKDVTTRYIINVDNEELGYFVISTNGLEDAVFTVEYPKRMFDEDDMSEKVNRQFHTFENIKFTIKHALTPKNSRKKKVPIEKLLLVKKAMEYWLDEGKNLTPASELAGVDKKTVRKYISDVLEIIEPEKRKKWEPLLKALGELP